MPFPVGWPPRPASGRRSLRFYKTGTATANYRDNAYLFRDANKALAVLGSTLNGRVIVNYDTIGLAGNAFNIQIILPGTGGPLPLAAALTGNLITVDLAIDAANNPVPAANTATLVAGVVNALVGFTAVATGTGADSFDRPEGPVAFFFGGGMPIVPTPWVPPGGATTRAVTGNTIITSSPAGGGAYDQVSTEIHHWSHSIRIVNTGGALLTYSFDGINDHGVLTAATLEVIMNFRHEAGICFKGSAAFAVEAW